MEENNMRRLMTLMMILFVMTQTANAAGFWNRVKKFEPEVPVAESTEDPTPILTSINGVGESIIEFRNELIEMIVPSVKLPNDVPAKEVKCLADNIYFEAKNEPYEGQLAVAQVTINRLEHPEYPKTVCGVVWQQNKNRRTGKRVAQFSWTLDGRSDYPKSKTAYEEAYSIAEEVLLYGVESAMIGTQVIYYHANYVNPRWRNVQRVAKIGNHIFYQPRT
jgi:spore germination cell wall hydrolase CwlJ-like protein